MRDRSSEMRKSAGIPTAWNGAWSLPQLPRSIPMSSPSPSPIVLRLRHQAGVANHHERVAGSQRVEIQHRKSVRLSAASLMPST